MLLQDQRLLLLGLKRVHYIGCCQQKHRTIKIFLKHLYPQRAFPYLHMSALKLLKFRPLIADSLLHLLDHLRVQLALKPVFYCLSFFLVFQLKNLKERRLMSSIYKSLPPPLIKENFILRLST